MHVKGKYECYDCNPPPPPKTFPVCTIRDTPDKIEHCVAWAKYFFELLFGKVQSQSHTVPMVAVLTTLLVWGGRRLQCAPRSSREHRGKGSSLHRVK